MAEVRDDTPVLMAVPRVLTSVLLLVLLVSPCVQVTGAGEDSNPDPGDQDLAQHRELEPTANIHYRQTVTGSEKDTSAGALAEFPPPSSRRTSPKHKHAKGKNKGKKRRRHGEARAPRQHRQSNQEDPAGDRPRLDQQMMMDWPVATADVGVGVGVGVGRSKSERGHGATSEQERSYKRRQQRHHKFHNADQLQIRHDKQRRRAMRKGGRGKRPRLRPHRVEKSGNAVNTNVRPDSGTSGSGVSSYSTSTSTSTSTGSTGATTDGDGVLFSRRSEEKQALVGKRTLQVLSSRVVAASTPPHLLVGMLDIPAIKQRDSDNLTTSTKERSKAEVHGSGQTYGQKDQDHDILSLDPQDWLQRLMTATALGTSLAISSSNSDSESPCERWMGCSAQLSAALHAQLAALPACPCTFPSNVFYYNKIWDRKHSKNFRWRDASGPSERLDVYRPGAAYCIRSLHTAPAGILAAQHCCYDRERQLLTRGSGAGTPALVSPDVSTLLHDTLDVRPWRICKGDFTRYNEVRPPNNDNKCNINPKQAEFLRQAQMSQLYR